MNCVEQADSFEVASIRGADAALEARKDEQYFSFGFGCNPGTGVASNTTMCRDICEAMLEALTEEMTCTYPEAVEAIQGRDANFEFANSSTLKPLLLFYTHNVVTEIHGYVFAQDHLDNFEHVWEGTELLVNGYRRTGDVLSATDLA